MTIQHTRNIVKSLFILFIIVVCIYLLPRVAINAFITRIIKPMGQPLSKLNLSSLPPKTAPNYTVGLFPHPPAPPKTRLRRSCMSMAMPEICRRTGR